MEVTNLTTEYYGRVFDGKAPHVYASAAFNRLNATLDKLKKLLANINED